MKFHRLSEAIRQQIALALPELERVTLSAQTAPPPTWSGAQPAAQLALSGIPNIKLLGTGEQEAEWQLTLYLLIPNTWPDALGTVLLEQLLLLIPGQRWGLEGIRDTRSLSVENRTSETSTGTIWAIHWHQAVCFGDKETAAGITPTQVYSCHQPAQFSEAPAYQELSHA